jgi:hypothetical protein
MNYSARSLRLACCVSLAVLMGINCLSAQTGDFSAVFQTVLTAAPDNFASLRGEDDGKSDDGTQTWKCRVYLPAAENCHVFEDQPYFYSSRFANTHDQDVAKNRYNSLLDSIQAALPPGWTSREVAAQGSELARHKFMGPNRVAVQIVLRSTKSTGNCTLTLFVYAPER